MHTQKTLAIIIPIYQPSDNWDSLLIERIHLFLDRLPAHIIAKVHLIDDGSSPPVLNPHNDFIFYSYKENFGKGYAIRFALSQIIADIYLYTDIDLPYLPESMVEMVNIINAGQDIVLAKRQRDYQQQIFFFRKIMSSSLKLFIKYVIRLHNSDTQGGLKAMNEKGKSILLETKINRYLFDLEWIKLAEKSKLKISSVPVALQSSFIQKKLAPSAIIKEIFNLLKLLYIKA